MRAIGKYIVITPKKEVETETKGGLILGEANREDIRYRIAAVSYTHLTLPTICSV